MYREREKEREIETDRENRVNGCMYINISIEINSSSIYV